MKLIDDALGSNTFNFLRDNITSPELGWHFIKNTALELDHNSEKDFSFAKTVYDCDLFGSIPTDPLFIVCYNALLTCLDRAGLELHELYRIRLNMYTRQGESYTHLPHVDDDQRQSMQIGILYMTTNINSPTVLYANQFEYGVDTNTAVEIKQKDFITKYLVHSVANRFLLFDGATYHSSTIPTQEAVRININYNFLLR